MQHLGFVLLGLTVIALVVGLVWRAKLKKIISTPHVRTGEIARNPQGVADDKAMVSCERVAQQATPFVAPCSGKPCLYWHVKIERSYTKHVSTENGVKTERHTDTVGTR